MNQLPDIAKKPNLTYQWWYRESMQSEPFALVTRHDVSGQKKWFHQYRLINGEWTEGTATPLPIFGLHTLQNADHDQTIFIFEGEKAAEAAHHLNLIALTSMMGSGNAQNADWAVLARYRKHKRFVLIPDHDVPGKEYMRTVYTEILKANPQAEVGVCPLLSTEKGADFVDWIKAQENSPHEWDEFSPIDEPASLYLKKTFELTVGQCSVSAEDYFSDQVIKPTFGPFEPLAEYSFPIKSCPIDTFPNDVKEWLLSLADQMQVPIDYLAVPFLIYAGTAIGRMRGIRVRRGMDWVEFPNLWGMLIGRPSLMKSPAMKAVRKPLDSLIAQSREKYNTACKEHAVKKMAWEALKKAKEAKLKKTCKDKLLQNSFVELESLIDSDMDQELQSPKHKRYKTDDSTVEKLGELLIENPQGLLLFRDELLGWLRSFEKSGRENDRPFFLQSWSGKEDFDVDRIGRGSLYVPSLYLSVLGSIQPGPLSRYVLDALNGGSGDDGFLQRFQLMVWPESRGEWKLLPIVSLSHLEEKMQTLFTFFDKLDFDADGQPIFLEFDSIAQSLFDDWQTQLENRLRQGGLPPHVEAHLAKYKKLIPALSLIFHFLYAIDCSDDSETIRKSHLESAIIWAEYLESHAEKVYHSGANAVLKGAHNLIQHIKRGDVKEPFSARDVYQGHHWSGLANAKEVEEVVSLLCEKNYLVAELMRTSGRSSNKYWVHPDIFKNT